MKDASALGDMLRRRLGAARPADVWAQLTEAGVTGLCVAQASGGLGLTVADAAPVLDALGELGLATPFLESCVLAPLLLQGLPEAEAALQAIARGGIVAIAGLEPGLRAGVSATQTPGGWELNGLARLVLDGGTADHLLVAAEAGGATALFLADIGPDGTQAREYPTLDDRLAADIRFQGAKASLLRLEAADALEAAQDTAIVGIAIEGAALMRQLLATTVAHVRQREQFGQPIGKFQVVQHRLVDMQIEGRRAAAMAARALEALGTDVPNRRRMASAAKVTVAEAGRFVGQNAVQLHGAMGMTRELDVGRYFRRLTVIEGQMGSADEHRARFAGLAA